MGRDGAFDQISRRLPMAVLRAMLRESLKDLRLALYLHRVGETHRPSDPAKGLQIKGSALDVVLDELAALSRTQTMVHFDDGYQDAARYVDSRAPRFRNIHFVFNVCPEKLEHRAGFRWDLLEEQRVSKPPVDVLWDGADVSKENQRQELRALGDAPQFRLASVEEVKQLARHENVALGNHTNCHFPLSRLSDAALDHELKESTAMFERLFGKMSHFAFPFGYPNMHFGMREVTALRAMNAEHIWCTRESPYEPSWSRPGAVLPRIQLLGTWTVKHMLLWIIQRSAVYRVRKLRGVTKGDLPI